MEQRNYFGLDLVRFGAALMVALYHLAFWDWLPERSPTPPIAPVSIFSAGWVGVEIFFVLSGFVIALSAQGKTVGQFITGRAARLYPAAWMCATISFIVLHHTQLLPDYFRSIALSPIGPWIDGAYWTLGV